jgi:NADH-quinone oxidoreductase subunit F
MANEVCYRTLGLDQPWSIKTYMSVGGYEAWKKILAGQLTPDQVIDEVKRSGCAGAAAPASRPA